MKRSEIKRRGQTADKAVRKPLKPKVCKAPSCGQTFPPRNSLQVTCSVPCAAEWATAKVERERRREAKRAAMERRRKQADDRERVKTIPQLRREAQAAVNRLARELDEAAGLPCITCGRHVVDDDLVTGSRWHAGHYASRGSAPEIGLTLLNIHRQCAGCNRPGGHTREKYRQGLRARYGDALVEWLDGPHDAARLRHDDLRLIRDQARAATKYHRQLRRDGHQVDPIGYRLDLFERTLRREGAA